MKEIQIDGITYTKLYEKMKNEGIEKAMTIDMYVQRILENIVKDIVIEPKPLPKAKACKRIF